jgi:hypothetical protein
MTGHHSCRATARSGIDDSQRHQPPSADFDWVAFTWLSRLAFMATFLVGLVVAIESQSFWTAAGAAVLLSTGRC